MEFLESLIERKQQYAEERDRLLLRMLEVKIINTFNMYRVPFLAASLGFCLMMFFRTQKPLIVRLFPLLVLGTFSSVYHYNIGQYGVYRNVDLIFKVLTDKRDSEVGRHAVEFLENLESERAARVKQMMSVKRKREREDKGLTDDDPEIEAEPPRERKRWRDLFKAKKNEALTDEEETTKKRRFFKKGDESLTQKILDKAAQKIEERDRKEEEEDKDEGGEEGGEKTEGDKKRKWKVVL